MSRQQVVLIEGDGIGPEIARAVREIFAAAEVPVDWVMADAGLDAFEKHGKSCPQETMDAIRSVGVALKGPTTTPVGSGHKSVNVTIRKALETYANVRPAQTIPGIKTRFENVDLIVVRENIEDTYGGVEHYQSWNVAQCLRLITRQGCWKIHKFAFELARQQGRKKITCVHKANIMKLTDGLFLDVFREVAADYPDIEAADLIVDNTCMQLVARPEQFDMLVLPNLFGDIVSDLCAGLVGGLGVAPGANIGDSCAVFEAVHGSAPDIAGMDLANPTAILLSSISMLRYLSMGSHADKIERALRGTLQSGRRTRDLKGELGTMGFAMAVCETMRGLPAVSSDAVRVTASRINVPAVPMSPPKETVIRGFDFFVNHGGGLPTMPATVGKFSLTMISNRGTAAWPGPPPEFTLVDVHRCRYVSTNGATAQEVDAAIAELAKSHQWAHVEKLFEFDDRKGYSGPQAVGT